MSTKLIRKHPCQLSRHEYLQCFGLNFGPEGSLQDVLVESVKERYFDWVYIIKEGETIISWSLVYEIDSKPGWAAMFWTRLGYRRKGHGSRIIKAIQSDFKKCYVIPHDEASGAFFHKHRRGKKKTLL